MNVRSYRPGGWFGIVGARAVVALPPTEKARVAALWELVDGGTEDFDVLLDALISGGLRELPGFVLASSADGETSVVIRGAARAELVVDGESVTVEGTGATTWVERSFSRVSRLSVLLEEPDGEEAASYTVDGGLFRVSRIDESPAGAQAEAHGGAPAAAPLEDLGIDTEPELEAEPEAPVRSPEPPSWTPPPPPPLRVLPPMPATEAMQLPPEPDPEPEPDDALDPDHDGLTRTGAWQPPAESPPGIPGQEPAPDVTVPVARLVISSGEVVDVDRAVVIGRAPEARRFSETEQPTIVTVPSPNLEISSTHLEVRPGSGADHGSAVVTDLGSTNGTVVVQPGLGPEDLVPGVAVQLVPGAVIDLGDGVTIQVTQP